MPNLRMDKALDFDPNRLSAQVHGKAVEHLFVSQEIHTVGDVILPAVPGASNAIAVEFSSRDGATLVSTHAVDCVELLRGAKDGDDAARDEQFATLADFPVNNSAYLVPSHQLIQFLLHRCGE